MHKRISKSKRRVSATFTLGCYHIGLEGDFGALALQLDHTQVIKLQQQRERLMGSPLWIWLFRRMAWLLLPVRGNLHSPSQLLMLTLEGSSKNFLKDMDKLWSRHWLGTDGLTSSVLAALSTSQVLSTICRAFRSKPDRYWASLWSLATINES